MKPLFWRLRKIKHLQFFVKIIKNPLAKGVLLSETPPITNRKKNTSSVASCAASRGEAFERAFEQLQKTCYLLQGFLDKNEMGVSWILWELEWFSSLGVSFWYVLMCLKPSYFLWPIQPQQKHLLRYGLVQNASRKSFGCVKLRYPGEHPA